MQNAIILHGCPEKEEYYNPRNPSESNAHWLPWLQKELIIRDIHAVTPEIPNSYEPVYSVWCREVERFDITPHTVLVGHSCGGGFWLRYLSEHPELRVNKVVLVAPWFDPNRTIPDHFFDFAPDREVAQRTKGITIFHADDDGDSVQWSLDFARRTFDDLNFIKMNGYGHFTWWNLQTERFPELLAEIVGKRRPRAV